MELPVGEPPHQATNRRGGEVEQGGAALPVEADGEGEGEGLATPWRLYARGEDLEVEASVVNDGAAAGAHGIPEHAGAVDLPSPSVEQGVVEEEVDASLLGDEADEALGGEVPKIVEGPSGGADQAVVGVMRAAADEAASTHHAGDGAAGRAEDPCREEFLEGGEDRGGEEGLEELEEGQPPREGLGGRVDRRVLGPGALRFERSREAAPEAWLSHTDETRGYYPPCGAPVETRKTNRKRRVRVGSVQAPRSAKGHSDH